MTKKRSLELMTLALTILAFCSAPLLAEGPWLPLPGGLQGHHIWAIEVSPSGWMLAGTAIKDPKTMYRSTDFGGTWTEVEGLPAGVEIWDIEIDSTDENVVYAGLNGAGIWKSLDGGVTWSWSYLYGQMWAVKVSPTHPWILYAASESGGVYRSDDAGLSWIHVSQGVIDNAKALVVHPEDPAIALAGTPFDGIFRTTDGGATWSQVNTGFGFDPHILTLWIDPAEPTTVYAGEELNGLFKSLDGGVSWFKPDPTLFVTVGDIRALDGDLFITNIRDDNGVPAYRSSDGGVSWEPLPRQPDLPGNLWPPSMTVVPGLVLLGTSLYPNLGGIYFWELPVTVDTVLTWIDDAVSDESLIGSGTSASGDRRLNALINMVELTADLIDAGLIQEACAQLLDVLLKTDGQSPPPDFVEGPAAEDLARYIQDLRDNLGCS